MFQTQIDQTQTPSLTKSSNNSISSSFLENTVTHTVFNLLLSFKFSIVHLDHKAKTTRVKGRVSFLKFYSNIP
jgi:hypothetical protein